MKKPSFYLIILASFLFVFATCEKEDVKPGIVLEEAIIGTWEQTSRRWISYENNKIIEDHHEPVFEGNFICRFQKDGAIANLGSVDSGTYDFYFIKDNIIHIIHQRDTFPFQLYFSDDNKMSYIKSQFDTIIDPENPLNNLYHRHYFYVNWERRE